jgi:hypothetical protein
VVEGKASKTQRRIIAKQARREARKGWARLRTLARRVCNRKPCKQACVRQATIGDHALTWPRKAYAIKRGRGEYTMEERKEIAKVKSDAPDAWSSCCKSHFGNLT